MPIKLDLKDRRILYELDKNARQPASAIGRAVRLSPEAVNYRIKRLFEEKVIFKFMTLLDTAKLGMTTYKVFYRFQKTTLEKEQEILDYLEKSPNTQLVTGASGMFDLNINFLTSSAEELNNVLNEFNAKFGEYVADRQVNILVLSHFFLRDYLVGKKREELRKPMLFGSKPILLNIDGTDKAIISHLAHDARMPAVTIARNISISADAVIARIRKLEQAGIIQNYALFPNYACYPYSWNYLLLKFRDLTEKEETRFFTFCKSNPLVWFYSKMIGPWDCVINIDAAQEEELRSILMAVKREFSAIIKEYSLLKINTIKKFNQYPMGK